MTMPALGQQDLLTTQWAYNKLTVNPAYAGGKDLFSARALHRQQWVGVDGRPVTTVLNFHSPLLNSRMGLGLSYAHDKLGVLNTHYVAISYAYRLPLENGHTLAFGVNGGMQTFEIRTSELEAVHSTDPFLQSDLSKVNARVGTGIYYYDSKFYVGVSAPNLIPNRLYKEDEVASEAFQGEQGEQSVHLYGMAGYAIEFAGGDFVLKPQVLFKAVTSREKSAPFQADFNLSLILYERLVVGGTVRTTFSNRSNSYDLENVSSADVMIGVYANKNWYIGYAYDFTLGKLNQYDTGSHEIMLGFDMDFKKTGVFTPRYF
jgi:type IX secretion system PorP/SprF family membrane protein